MAGASGKCFYWCLIYPNMLILVLVDTTGTCTLWGSFRGEYIPLWVISRSCSLTNAHHQIFKKGLYFTILIWWLFTILHICILSFHFKCIICFMFKPSRKPTGCNASVGQWRHNVGRSLNASFNSVMTYSSYCLLWVLFLFYSKKGLHYWVFYLLPIYCIYLLVLRIWWSGYRVEQCSMY